MGDWSELFDATQEATGQKVDKTVNEGEKPLNPDELTFKMFEKRLSNIGKALNELFIEIQNYKKQKGLR